jgi:hypothetical protein
MEQAAARSNWIDPGAGSLRRRGLRRPMRPLLWGVAILALGHLALAYVVASVAPEIRDPDQIFKLRKLQQCLVDAGPQRPLILMMGSSRVAMGYRPELVERSDGPIYYNYGLCFAGPLLDLITLHRLLDAGIQPRKILLEVWPPHLAAESADGIDSVSLDVNRLSWRDLGVLAPYTAKPKNLYRNWIVNRLESWSTYRFTLTRLFGPEWLETSQETTARWSGLQERGWLGQDPYRDHPAPDVYQRYLVHTRYHLAKELKQPTMGRDARSALTEFLSVCRGEKIQVELIWLPESPRFRDSYEAQGLAEASAELRALARREGMRLIDANDWVPEDGFVDGYHLTHAGAELFTRTLESEVLGPAVAKSIHRVAEKNAFLVQPVDTSRQAVSKRNAAAASTIR